jgi:hypothetical protein
MPVIRAGGATGTNMRVVLSAFIGGGFKALVI